MRFYFKPDQAHDGVVILDKKESHHAISVLRLGAGDVVDLFDGLGNQFRGVVAGRENGRLSVMLDKNAASAPALKTQISLAISVIKPEGIELLIQKACELGVFEIVPILTERSIVKLSQERWESKLDRWRKIALASCKQCGQSKIPDIKPIAKYGSFISDQARSYGRVLIPTLAVKGKTLVETLREQPEPQSVLALVGPEGDFNREEVDLAVSCGAVPVGLGSLVLRSETAAIYLLSILNFFYRECSNEKS